MSGTRASSLATLASLAALALLSVSACAHGAPGAGSLPRVSAAARAGGETYPSVAVDYESLEDANGHRLRMIVTHPQGEVRRQPAIFIAGWLSCDSVEAPAGTRGAPQLVFRELAQLPGFVTLRLEKAGVGDSEGDCGATDFRAELDAYRRAFRRLAQYPFVDPGAIFVFGLSNGGGFAPLVADGAPVKGYVVEGGWVKTWFEHMLEIERRRLALEGHPSQEINRLMKRVESLYTAYLLEHRTPRSLLGTRSERQALWDDDLDHQYGRPIRYYQQLQDLDLMAAWSAVTSPTLAIHGAFDWIMGRADLETIAALVNRNSPGAAEFVELPDTGHGFAHYRSLQAAFDGTSEPFDPAHARRVAAWFAAHR